LEREVVTGGGSGETEILTRLLLDGGPWLKADVNLKL